MPRKLGQEKNNIDKDKMLVNIGEQRKGWIKRVGELSGDSMTEIMRLIVEYVAVEEPEAFVSRLANVKLRMKIRDLDAREKAIQTEKENLMRALESPATVEAPAAITY